VSRRYRGEDPRKCDYWFSSADESAAAEFIEYCRFWAKELFQTIAEVFTEREIDSDTKQPFTTFRVLCPNGTKIVAMSSNPRRFRSKGGDVCLDEFDFHDNPEAMFDAASPVTQWGGSIRIFSTPDGEGSLYNQLTKNCKRLLVAFGITEYRGRVGFPSYAELRGKAAELGISPVLSYHRVTIDDAIAEGIVEKISAAVGAHQTREEFRASCRAKSRSEDAFMQEYMCTPSADNCAWLGYALIGSCEDEGCSGAGDLLTGYEGGVCDVGVDVGRTTDLTVITVLENVGDVRWTRLRLELKNVSLPEQERILAGVLRSIKFRRCCIDKSGIGLGLFEHIQEEFGEHCIEGIDFTGPNKHVLAVAIKDAFEDRTIRIAANDTVLKDDLHRVRKGVTATGQVRFEGERTKDGHADRFWAYALAIHAGSVEVHVPLEFQGAGKATFAGQGAW
jgi:phage FluMu gp28-like protein